MKIDQLENDLSSLRELTHNGIRLTRPVSFQRMHEVMIANDWKHIYFGFLDPDESVSYAFNELPPKIFRLGAEYSLGEVVDYVRYGDRSIR